jgi:hypothetical protein
MLRLTAMISTAFVKPNRATADDEAKIFMEESDDVEEFLYDEEDEELSSGSAPITSRDEIYSASELAVDPWDKFTPRVTPKDGSALSQAFANNIPPVAPRPVTRPKQKASTNKSGSSQPSSAEELSTDHTDFGSIFALSFPLMVLGGAAFSFEKEKDIIAKANDPQHVATGTPKIKVVMVNNEPYGLDRGRRYYNGVYVVREHCDALAPKASSECVNSIADYLEEVSSTGGGGEESQETASAIISYLDSLSSGGSALNYQNQTPQQATGVAFSSYLQQLSAGSIPAPSSAESVAVYLDSLAAKDRERVSRLEARVHELETSIEDKIAHELNKIATFLVEQSGVSRNAYIDYEVDKSGGHAYRNGYNVNGSGGQSAGNRSGITYQQQVQKGYWQ